MRQLCDACSGHRLDTAVDSPKYRCLRAGGLEEHMIPHLYVLYNWMQSGALQHGGLNGAERKMDKVSSNFTSAAPLIADCVDTRISHSSHSDPIYHYSDLCHFYFKSNIDNKYSVTQIHADLDLLPAYVN